MKETLELRVNERHAARLFGDDEGRRVAASVREVVLPTSDPRLPDIAALQRELSAQGESFFWGWGYVRTYTRTELRGATLLACVNGGNTAFAGAVAGTVYDTASACPVCGAGQGRLSPLRLHLAKLPRVHDIARSSSDEWIVSRRFVEACTAAGARGAEFVPVEFRRLPPGRTVDWFALVPTGAPVRMHARTVLGVGPFLDPAADAPYVCPLGDTVGYNRLSELHVAGEGPPDADFAATREYLGHRMGLFTPHRELVLSGRLYRALTEAGIRGLAVEIARLGGP